MATYSADKRNLGRGLHEGLNTVVSVYTFSTTASVGDIIQFCRLPNQATVTRAAIYNYGSGGADHVDFGTTSDIDRFYDSTSVLSALHETNRLDVGLAYKFSASNDSETGFEYVMATVLVADSSVGEKVAAIVQYVIAN